MARLAHISDIHFGPTFDVPIWNRVRQKLLEFNPDVIVATGDFVDHPSPFHLLAAKSELQDLCEACEAHPQLFVVPGNHDVSEWGNFQLPFRSKWFERIMFSDTRTARKRIEQSLGIRLGLNSDSKRLPLSKWLKRLNPANAIRRNIPKNTCDGRVQSCAWRFGANSWPIENTCSQFFVACFNSNPQHGGPLKLAKGAVAPEQVTGLGGVRGRAVNSESFSGHSKNLWKAQSSAGPILLRVAALHHHPLPIALPRESLRGRVHEGFLEPYLILTNSGDLLHRLQEEKFDIVLHGHKHQSQFARIEMQADSVDSYPLIVVAGGSTANNDATANNNTIRLIEIEASGRLLIRTVEQGYETERPSYREPVKVFKERAYLRAQERAGRVCKELHWESAIDGVGNMRNRDRYVVLQALPGGEEIREIPCRYSTPPYGESFEERIRPDDDSLDRLTLFWRDRDGTEFKLNNMPTNGNGFCWLRLTQPLKPDTGQAVTFGIRNVMANSIAMTQWELEERKRLRDNNGTSDDPILRILGHTNIDPDRESTWRYISFPIDRLFLRLTHPPELDRITPEVRCRRHRKYPDYPLTFRGDQTIEYNRECFDVDEDLQEAEARHLRYDAAERRWTLEVERPVPGYVYELSWKVPDESADAVVIGRTQTYQKMLLDLGRRLASGQIGQSDQECLDLFANFASGLDRFKAEDPSEQQAAFLMVYDRADLHLHSVVAQFGRSNKVFPFKVPLGGGVSGAGFLRRESLVWGRDPDSDSMIKPVPVPDFHLEYILALPIYYQQQSGTEKGHLDKRPGATIGVVTVCSDSPGSRLAKTRGESVEATESTEGVRALAQSTVIEMLGKLSRSRP